MKQQARDLRTKLSPNWDKPHACRIKPNNANDEVASQYSLNKDSTRNFLQAINVAAAFRSAVISLWSTFRWVVSDECTYRSRSGPSLCRGAGVYGDILVADRGAPPWRPRTVSYRGTVARVRKEGETGFPNSWKFVKLPWPIGERLIED